MRQIPRGEEAAPASLHVSAVAADLFPHCQRADMINVHEPNNDFIICRLVRDPSVLARVTRIQEGRQSAVGRWIKVLYSLWEPRGNSAMTQ